ncbi:MAG: hypothetical protein Q4G30_06155 [Actinomycetaceae bacterium]|nr:hypothetical protein [Actinomycetaceae bacterium]
MARLDKLQAAVQVFKDLGWDKAKPADAPDLPLGTTEQRKIALAGLSSGQWSEYQHDKNADWVLVSFIDVDPHLLALFALRCGVSATRAVDLLYGVDKDTLIRCVTQRGRSFATQFIEAAGRGSRRIWEHSLSVYGYVLVKLVYSLDLEIPTGVEYLKDWVALAYASLSGKTEHLALHDAQAPSKAFIQPRFLEHLEVALQGNAPATGPLSDLIPLAVAEGWVERTQAMNLVFNALGLAARPGDRKRLSEVLLQDLKATKADVLDNAALLIPVLALGESVIVQSFAPTLIAGVSEDTLAELALSCLYVLTKKAQKIVLDALGKRPRPSKETLDLLQPRIEELAALRDPQISRAAEKVIKAWGIDIISEGEEAPGAALEGLWRETPPLWSVPAFTLRPDGSNTATPEALTEALRVIAGRRDHAMDIHTERFLGLANAVARHNPQAARRAMAGATNTDLFSVVKKWVDQDGDDWNVWKPAGYYMCVHHKLFRAVFAYLGDLPCVLSTPSFDDLSVSLDDLLARLDAYAQAQQAVLEPDFFFALTRLDISNADPARIKDLDVPVLLVTGDHHKHTATHIVRDYLADPLPTRQLAIDPELPDFWYAPRMTWPKSLQGLITHTSLDYGSEVDFTVVPNGNDATLTDLQWYDEVNHSLGLDARQIARRRDPLPPGGAINMLAIQRGGDPVVAQDCALALSESWERGLLVPGVADVTYLDWRTKISSLAAFAGSLGEAARAGMLSVAWPVLDELLVESLKAPRMLSGTAQVAEVMNEMAPEVLAAIQMGKAPQSASTLPGLRALAARGGSSLAVRAARAAIQIFPEGEDHKPETRDNSVASTPPMSEEEFVAIWPKRAGRRPAVPDGATFEVGWIDPQAPTKQIYIDLYLPGQDVTFRVHKGGWFYDIETEGQCRAAVLDALGQENPEKRDVWLHWDGKKWAIEEHRNWREGNYSPLTGQPSELPDGLVAVVVASLAEELDVYAARNCLETLIQDNKFGSKALLDTVPMLLQSPAFSPARAVYVLEANPKYLPWLWPLLTEPLRTAAQSEGTPPRWTNRVLDVALYHAPILREAGQRGLLPADAWAGVKEMAQRKGSSAAIKKAQTLTKLLA